MFINSKKNFEIREGEQKLIIPRNFIGEIPDWAARHWLIKAAIKDGSIATPESAADKFLDKADKSAKKKADAADKREDKDISIETPETTADKS